MASICGIALPVIKKLHIALKLLMNNAVFVGMNQEQQIVQLPARSGERLSGYFGLCPSGQRGKGMDRSTLVVNIWQLNIPKPF